MFAEDLRIGFVAPPFAGHLNPQLQLASGLRKQGFQNQHFFSTPEAKSAVELCDFPFYGLLEGRSHLVFEISDTKERVGSNPMRLLRQLRTNLSLLSQLQTELESFWLNMRPDVIIADLTVPVAGLLARKKGIAWWSSMPTVCVIDTGDGTPSYLGGWMPPRTWFGRARDVIGRKLVSSFKIAIHAMFRKRLASLGLNRIYREDGYEQIYSSEKILGLGVEEFEFQRTWPEALEFIGPLTASPPHPHVEPRFVEGKPHILVSLGTHLWWAKEDARELIRRVAAKMPDCEFHFTNGKPSYEQQESQGNFQVYDFIPYDKYVGRYAASINHAGTGVMYACLQEQVPILAWPQDYDQFDHTARLVHHQLGLKCRPREDAIVEDLRTLLTDQELAARLEQFGKRLSQYAPVSQVKDMLYEFATQRQSALRADPS